MNNSLRLASELGIERVYFQLLDLSDVAHVDYLGAGIVASSGALGILIPPSIVMVMYAVSTNSSIGALFMALVWRRRSQASRAAATGWRGGHPARSARCG